MIQTLRSLSFPGPGTFSKTMSRAGTPADNKPQQPTPVQFQFQNPIQYPMSQAQQNQAQQPAVQPAPTSSQATTPAPLGQTSSVATIPTSTQPSTTASQAPINAPGPSQSRLAAEQARKDRTLADFMLLLDDYEPLVSVYSHMRNRNLTDMNTDTKRSH